MWRKGFSSFLYFPFLHHSIPQLILCMIKPHNSSFFWALECQAQLTSIISFLHYGASLIAQLVKNLPAMREIWVWSLGCEDPLEKGKATHSSILAWRIPWTILSMGWQKVRHNWVTFTFNQDMCTIQEVIPISSVSYTLYAFGKNIHQMRIIHLYCKAN